MVVALRSLASLLALLLGLALALPANAAPQFPTLTGRVTDAANIIPVDARTRLTAKLEALEQSTGRQLVVATVPDLQDYDIADYGYQLGRAWGIGSKTRNDGAVLIVAPKERKLRIEVGYGLEGVLTDGISSLVINQTIVPRFKAGDMPGGIEAGVDALIQHLSLPAADAQRAVAAAASSPADQGDSGWIVILVVLAFLFIVFRMVRRKGRGGTRYAGAGAPVVIWGSGDGGSSWGGGFDSGGSDFSGSGGDFGGGGASGDW